MYRYDPTDVGLYKTEDEQDQANKSDGLYDISPPTTADNDRQRLLPQHGGHLGSPSRNSNLEYRFFSTKYKYTVLLSHVFVWYYLKFLASTTLISQGYPICLSVV